jgi:hypothetical protein
MTLEQQVCSLQLAKRLKEFGIAQESLFWWNIGTHYTTDFCDLIYGKITEVAGKLESYSAFTVAELGEMLKPFQFIEIDTLHGKEMWVQYCHFRECVYRCGDSLKVEVIGDTEADARAKCLVNLLENKLITL